MANGEYEIRTRLARVEQHVTDLDSRMTAMGGVTTSVIQLTEQVGFLRRDLDSYAKQTREDREAREDREEADRREKRIARRALWALTVVILASLIGAAATILSSGIH